MIPGFVDSHSHLVFAGDRTEEFNARMSGRAYSAGGIRTTVAATRAATDAELEANLTRHLAEALRQGTTTFETKSGYGLTVEDEARALRIAARHTEEVTYLGAHIVAPELADDPAAYVALVTGEMLDACAPHARWIDVFCEKGAFDGDQARAILTAGKARGLHPRIHANQLSYGPGVQLAVELDAASADHCTHLTDADVDALASGRTVATLLPGAEFSTRAQWPDARRLLDAGVTVALSTDCNPGSSYTSSVPFCIALAVRDMGMTPRRGGVVGHRGRRRGAAPHRHRPDRPRRPRRSRPAGRAEPCPPGLPAGRPAGRRGVAAGRPRGLRSGGSRRDAGRRTRVRLVWQTPSDHEMTRSGDRAVRGRGCGMAGAVSRRGLLGSAALVGAGALAGVVHSAGTAAAEAPLTTPFTPVTVPHLAEAERMVQYQRMLAAGHLPEGLAGHWPLDGRCADVSGGGRPLTLGTGASWTTLRAGGELTLDGRTGYAATGSVLDTTAPFTVSAWVRLAPRREHDGHADRGQPGRHHGEPLPAPVRRHRRHVGVQGAQRRSEHQGVGRGADPRRAGRVDASDRRVGRRARPAVRRGAS
ncbi:hypothetical protein GCM10020256_46570 [Streptomyces thermocoprophilus]